jgi:hypothetical protein
MDERSEISIGMKIVFAFVAGVLLTGAAAFLILRHTWATAPQADVPAQSAMATTAPAPATPSAPPAITSAEPEPSAEPPAVPKATRVKARPSAFSKSSEGAHTSGAAVAASLPKGGGSTAPDSVGPANAGPDNAPPAGPVASAQNLPDLSDQPAGQPVQNAPGQQAIAVVPQPQPQMQQPAVAPQPDSNVAPPPHTVTIAAGTNLVVRLTEQLSSNRNTAGDAFRGTLDQQIILDGFIIAEKGSAVRGKIVAAEKAGHVTGKSELALELTEINTTDGQTVYVHTSDVTRQGPSSTGENAAKVGGGAALGAIIGAIAGGGKGAAIGAGVGGAAGTGVMLSTRGKPTVLPVETRLTFRLNDPVMITEQIRH